MFFDDFDSNEDRQPVEGFDIAWNRPPDRDHTSTRVREPYTYHDNHERLYCELSLLADEGSWGEADALVNDYVQYANLPGNSADNSLLAQVELRLLKHKFGRDPNDYYKWDPNEMLDEAKFQGALNGDSALMYALHMEEYEGGGIHVGPRGMLRVLFDQREKMLWQIRASQLKSILNAHYCFLQSAKSLLQGLGGNQTLTISKTIIGFAGYQSKQTLETDAELAAVHLKDMSTIKMVFDNYGLYDDEDQMYDEESMERFEEIMANLLVAKDYTRMAHIMDELTRIFGADSNFCGLGSVRAMAAKAYQALGHRAKEAECYRHCLEAECYQPGGDSEGWFTAEERDEMKQGLVLATKKVSACAHCKNPGAKLKCGRCKSAKYCNQECQKKDWKQHKTQCIAAHTSGRSSRLI
jgi:hypothetical protein